MAKFTRVYRSYLNRVVEVEILRNSAAVKERADPVGNRNEINALCRGSIVLLSSHVEAYIKELGELALESFFAKAVSRDGFASRLFYHISKDFIDEIKDTSDPDRTAEKIFSFLSADVTFWSKVGPFSNQISAEKFNSGFLNPAFEKVRAYFNRFGYDQYRGDFYGKLTAEAQITENMLNHLVSTRNSIAHGNPAATKTPADLKDMIRIISCFCRTTDAVFGTWCRSRFCAIR